MRSILTVQAGCSMPRLKRSTYGAASDAAAGRPVSRRTPDKLTPREDEVLRQLRLGKTYRETAAALGMSWHTVATHAKAISRKSMSRAESFQLQDHLVVDTWSLTERERAVLTHLAAGKSQRGVAEALGKSPHTVRAHVRSILSKAGVATTAKLLALLRPR